MITRILATPVVSGVVFASLVAPSFALPPDWECALTYFNVPRMVPAGELSVLGPDLRVAKAKDEPGRSSYKLDMVRIEPGSFFMGS